MIVTRQRRKPFPWRRVLLPVVALALLAAALWWAPSRNWIANGPLAPVWRAPIWKPFTAPFDAAAQQATIRTQSAQVADLQKQLAQANSKIADRDKQMTQLQTQLDQAQQASALADTTKAKSEPAHANPAASSAPAAPGSDLSTQGTPDMQRTAAVWSSMDADAAAKIVQRLPDAYVARIFALMSPDAVGAILEAVPPAYAARLTQEHPEIQR
jgi:flagellar motility protein MotE (MotC chaperone)